MSGGGPGACLKNMEGKVPGNIWGEGAGGVMEDRKMALNCGPPQCYALLKNLATKCPNALLNALMPYEKSLQQNAYR